MSDKSESDDTEHPPQELASDIDNDIKHTLRFTLEHLDTFYETQQLSHMKVLSSPEWKLFYGLLQQRKRLIPRNSKREKLYLWLRKFAIKLLRSRQKHKDRPLVDLSAQAYIRPIASDIYYQKHIIYTEPSEAELKNQHLEVENWTVQPSFTIVTPVFNTALWMLNELIYSVLTQTYANWKWIIVDASSNEITSTYLQEAAKNIPQIILKRVENQGISANTNVGLELAEGEFILAVDHDDLLAPDALFQMAKCIVRNPDADLIYSDMDKLDPAGFRVRPLFKPGWSPEMMLCANIVTHLTCYRRSILEEVGYLDPAMDIAQDWDLYLRISEVTDRIYHVPRVLYHWRMSTASTAGGADNKNSSTPQIQAILAHLQRLDLDNPRVYFDKNSIVRAVHPIVKWDCVSNVLVSIVIVINNDQDRSNITQLIQHINDISTYTNYEIIVIDRLSTASSIASDDHLHYQHMPDKPSFYDAYNAALESAKGKYLIFLEAQVSTVPESWIQDLIQWFEKDEKISAVTAKVVRADETVDNVGAYLGVPFGYPFKGSPQNVDSVYGSEEWYRNWTAVTRGCFAIRAELIDHFNTDYHDAYSEMELCLQLAEDGYRCFYTPDVTVSLNRDNLTPTNQADLDLFHRRILALQTKADRYTNPNVWLRDSVPFYSFGLSEKSIYSGLYFW